MFSNYIGALFLSVWRKVIFLFLAWNDFLQRVDSDCSSLFLNSWILIWPLYLKEVSVEFERLSLELISHEWSVRMGQKKSINLVTMLHRLGLLESERQTWTCSENITSDWSLIWTKGMDRDKIWGPPCPPINKIYGNRDCETKLKL